MQTFLPYKDAVKSAQALDDKRLGKQRVEAIQIARCLLHVVESRWKNHPAVKMWHGYEPFLIKRYLRAILDEWLHRGHSSEKCEEHYRQLFDIVKDHPATKPWWLGEQLCITHRSRLIQKKPDHYSKIFVDTPDNLEYWWPVQ